jgi:HK97 family phage major capsid protein
MPNEHALAKRKKFNEVLAEIATLTATIETPDEADEKKFPGNTPENREKLAKLLSDGEDLRKSIEQDTAILGLQKFANDPILNPPAGHDGAFAQRWQPQKSLGEQFIESEAYKGAIVGGKFAHNGKRVSVDAKGFLFDPPGSKATFTTTGGGLDSTVNYVTPPGGGIVLVEQQRLTIRDLLPVGQTTMNSIPYIKETSFTNAADMVAEEGEKPEATLATEDATAPVKKIAVLIKVTDEMFADFPMMRDYVNTRLRFMVEAKEEQQLLNGTGAGNQITGILQTSGIQTQALSTDIAETTMKAITKIRSVGFFEPTGAVFHPNDWEAVRLLKDSNGQYYGGGPFTGAYGVGAIAKDSLWGLPVVVTTAIAEGTGLVGAFRLGAQIWQREGVRVEAFDQNEDDVNFNRVTVRVEERLALTVYRPLAFCKLTGI